MIPLPSCTPISLTVAASASDVPSSHIFSTRHVATSRRGERRGEEAADAAWKASCGATVTEKPAVPRSGSSTHADSLMSIVFSSSLGRCACACAHLIAPSLRCRTREQERREPPSTAANSKACEPSRPGVARRRPNLPKVGPALKLTAKRADTRGVERAQERCPVPRRATALPLPPPPLACATATSASSSSTTSAPRGGSSASSCARSASPKRTRPSTDRPRSTCSSTPATTA